MENLTPCKVGMCLRHHCPTVSAGSSPCGTSHSSDPNSPPLSLCWTKSPFLWHSYSSVPKTLPPPHSLGHEPLWPAGYKGKQVSRRDQPAELFFHLPCGQVLATLSSAFKTNPDFPAPQRASADDRDISVLVCCSTSPQQAHRRAWGANLRRRGQAVSV